jgi:hypothetical protein
VSSSGAPAAVRQVGGDVMRQRDATGKPAAITFTCDFHELVTGELRPGGPLVLRYDPLRIVPADARYRFGDPDRPVIAHVQFHATAPARAVTLHSPAGVIACPDVDLTGQGSMLGASLDVPADADRLILWFSFAMDGRVVYDSDYGANYHFGFACRELAIVEATVRPQGSSGRFDLVVQTAAAVEAVRVHYVLVADPACSEHEAALQPAGGEAGQPDTRVWEATAEVPPGAIVRFRVVYWLGGCRLVDDNSGDWYLAPEPVRDEPPQPSPALLAAAAAWR